MRYQQRGLSWLVQVGIFHEVFFPGSKLSLVSSPSAMWENVFLLVLTAVIKFGLTAWTFGMMVHELSSLTLGLY